MNNFFFTKKFWNFSLDIGGLGADAYSDDSYSGHLSEKRPITVSETTFLCERNDVLLPLNVPFVSINRSKR